MSTISDKLLPFGQARIRYASLAAQSLWKIGQTQSEQRQRRMTVFVACRPFLWFGHTVWLFFLYIGLLCIQATRAMLWCTRTLCVILYGATAAFLVLLAFTYFESYQNDIPPTPIDPDPMATAASIIDVYGTPTATVDEPQAAAISNENDSFLYNPRVSPESLQGISTAVSGYVRRQQAVDVNGHFRNNTYVDPHLRTPPGGFTDQQNFEANAWGAGVGIGLMATDTLFQYYDHWKKERAIEEARKKRGY